MHMPSMICVPGGDPSNTTRDRVSQLSRYKTTSSMSPSTGLALVGMLALLASLMWSPVFLSFSLLENELAEFGVYVDGHVVNHKSWIKRGKTHYLAEVRYVDDEKSYSVHLSGEGASRDRLPLGTVVRVKYLPRKAAVAEAMSVDASSSQGPGWWALVILWGATFLLFAASWHLRAKRRTA